MSTIKFRNFIRAVFLLTLFTPALSFAVGGTDGFVNLNKLILSFANGVVRSTGYMLFTLAVVAFFWGIVQFIWSARQGAEGKGIQKGTQFMKWGLIAIFVMFSLWGIIKFAQDVFQIQGENTIIVPSLDFIQSGGNGLNDTTGGNLGCPPPGILSGGRCINPQTGVPLSPIQAGRGCSDTSQCASGLTCVGTNASNKVCKGANANGAGAGNVAGGNQAGNGSGTGAGSESKKILGSDCIESPECNSNYCDVNNKCSIAIKGTKGFGYTCTDTTECKSGLYCDVDNLCNTTTATGDKPWGYSCGDSSECQSGFCDPLDNTCSTPNNGSGTAGINNGCGPGNGYPDDFGYCALGSSSGDTSASIQTCMDTGNSREMCACEARNETWNFNSGCSDGSSDVNSGGGINGYPYDETTSVGTTDRTVTSVEVTGGTDTSGSGIIDTGNGLQLDPCAYDPC